MPVQKHTQPAGTGSQPRTARRLTALAGAALAAVLVMVVGVGVTLGADQDQSVAQLDGEQITRQELAFHMDMLQREVQNGIQNRHSVPGTWDWQEPIGGEVPLETLQDAALEQAIWDKQIFLVAVELGLLDSARHSELLAATEAENHRRENATAAGEVVYGLREFEAQQFHRSLLTELEAEILRQLDDPVADLSLHVTDEEIGARLDADPDAWTVNVAVYDVERLAVPVPSDPEERREAANEARAQLADAGFEAFAAQVDPDAGAHLSSERIEGGDPDWRVGPRGEVLALVEGLEVGEHTAPVLQGGELVIYELTGKEVDRDQALTAYSSRIRQTLLAEGLEDLIAERMETGDIDVDLTAVRSVDMEEVNS